MSIEEMKQALEVLQTEVNLYSRSDPKYAQIVLTITALRQAIEEEEKREWVGLTDEDEIAFEWERVTGHGIFGGDPRKGRQMFLSPSEILEFAEAIEAKLREKNMEVEE